MPDLVALDLPGGPRFVDALRSCWEAGDAVAPIDQRLPAPARARLLDVLAPARVVDATGETPRRGSRPVDDGDALVVTTSGTSGEPKGVVLTHEAVRASALVTSNMLAVNPDHDHWLACLPLAHIGGLSVVTRAIHTGTPFTVHPGFDATAVDQAARDGATLVSLVPAVLSRIDATAFRRILLGGSAIPADRPDNTVATYGMSETGSGIVYDGHPLPTVELAIDDGEILVRGPMLFRCYRDGRPGDDVDPFGPSGWFRTGDAGHVGPDGRLSVFGRLGDVIVTGGEKVWPVQVERRLESHPRVAEAAVFGRPDPTWGERVVARVVPRDAAAPPSRDELADHVRQDLPPWCAPRELEIAARLPRTGIGKLARTELA